MMQEQSALFIPLINLVFEKNYEHDVPIININTKAYNKDKSKIMSDISFLIGNKTYHFECQYSDDQKMAFRMFEYDFHIALMDVKMTNNFTNFNFIRSCFFYIVPKESMPDKLEMQINFEEEGLLARFLLSVYTITILIKLKKMNCFCFCHMRF